MVSQQCINLEPLTALTFRFNDPNYSATQGGYHPVEIRLVRGLNGWLFDTITDFSYQGYGDWAELDKELDFDFLSPEFTHIYLGVLEHDDAIELYQLWENNFWLYCQMNTFSTALSCT
ncbi:DUF2787 family protein [Aeromonas caviae]|uniref:DUF2787 domain-containing protein n=1 Tax=Aeromonas caviae TaxID=648 RepID=A0AAV4YQD1_AERCA|nr:DUF2787 family protein [Aeromonas caviae]GJA33286.1 hypothetical protein KAM341_29640 [Aeromonas caviae]GJA37782.1 hypothetical protein KAM342_30250 [Aeromonas caviae]GJA42305.1 hypothetical protein KAM343_31010 [Aeromonas caviae]GJA51382.1 hypothetical protein KAM347_31730 [Aeromonas caviae]GJA60178.1 hypothetical protein KAM350_31710 [Aeromonas caviae]